MLIRTKCLRTSKNICATVQHLIINNHYRQKNFTINFKCQLKEALFSEIIQRNVYRSKGPMCNNVQCIVYVWFIKNNLKLTHLQFNIIMFPLLPKICLLKMYHSHKVYVISPKMEDIILKKNILP